MGTGGSHIRHARMAWLPPRRPATGSYVIGFIYGMGAGIAAVTAEYLYKQWDPVVPWFHGLHMWVPLQLGIGYCIYKLVNLPNTNLLDAFIVFAFCTALLRVVLATMILHQSIPVQSWIAFGLVFSATLIKTFWGKFT